MKKLTKLFFFSLLTPFFLVACNNHKTPTIDPYAGDVSLLTYGTTTVSYADIPLEEYDCDKLEINSSDTSLFTVRKETEPTFLNRESVVIDSNLENRVGLANLNFVYDGEPLTYTISVAVNYPKNLDEAYDAFTFAAMKLQAGKEFTVTFNFDNKMNSTLFDNSLEIYGRRGIIDYQSYQTGTAKENVFAVATNQTYGDIKSGMTEGDLNYQFNIPSFNAISRSIHIDNDENIRNLYINSVQQTLNVSNSEELFWSIEHGYRPILPDLDLNLNLIYDRAKNICINRTKAEWDRLTMYRELFDYLVSITYYDNDPNLNKYGYRSASYYLEGVFLDNGIAVCDGFAKAYALLCGILGLPCFRSYGYETGKNVGHAWNYVQLDNAWYLVCPTWAKIGFYTYEEDEDLRAMAELYNENVSFTKYDSFLASKNYFKSLGSKYSDLAFPSIKRSEARYSGNIDEINYHITSDADARTISERIRSLGLSFLQESCLYIEFSSNLTSDKWVRWMNIIINNELNAEGQVYIAYTPPLVGGDNTVFTLLAFKAK